MQISQHLRRQRRTGSRACAHRRNLETNYAGEPGTDRIRLFDLEGRKQVLSLVPDGDRPASFAFSPDGNQLVTGFWRGTATVWDISR